MAAHGPGPLVPRVIDICENTFFPGRNAKEDHPKWEPVHEVFLKHNIPAWENVGGDVDKVLSKRCVVCAYPTLLTGPTSTGVYQQPSPAPRDRELSGILRPPWSALQAAAPIERVAAVFLAGERGLANLARVPRKAQRPVGRWPRTRTRGSARAPGSSLLPGIPARY